MLRKAVCMTPSAVFTVGVVIPGVMGVALLLLIVPVTCLEFPVYRMQQYTLQGQPHGSQSSLVQAESRTLEAELLTRRCIIMRLKDFTMEKWGQILSQSAGAVLILVPLDLPSVLPSSEQNFMEQEFDLLTNKTLLPIYFALEETEVLAIYEETKAASLTLRSSSALEVLFGMVMGSGFQMITGETQSKPVINSAIVTLEGHLTGRGNAGDLLTVVIVAHYDSFGAAPWLAYGADSNGSGVAVLMEMIRLFHLLYKSPRSKPRYNLLFALTGGGKFNYQGSKHWIEEHLDHSETSILHENVAFVLCLDTLASGNTLYLHVSKPPPEGSAQWEFVQELQSVIGSPLFVGVNFSLIHKKINLGDSLLAWEHEQFSLRRVPSFTISHLDSHKRGLKNTILDTRSQVDIKTLTRNTRILSQALAMFMYKETIKETRDKLDIFQGELEVQAPRLTSIIDWLVSQPRATQLIGKSHPLLSTMEQLFRRHLSDVRSHVFKADGRHPEIIFYDQLKQTMTSYRVKPAVFDLFVAVIVAVYLCVIHHSIQNFGRLYYWIVRLIGKQKKK
ncbi:nicalin isoform X1 [Pelobates cultripes]|uniref:Nicalin n=1 Tax=Pelobates cultripes TaxID=61616 RepID=A0AAD1W7T8_PELCU|nr:nicalin isoform X1 [Pelobates cultripes]